MMSSLAARLRGLWVVLVRNVDLKPFDDFAGPSGSVWVYDVAALARSFPFLPFASANARVTFAPETELASDLYPPGASRTQPAEAAVVELAIECGVAGALDGLADYVDRGDPSVGNDLSKISDAMARGVRRAILRRALELANWNLSSVAKQLNFTDPSALRREIKRCGLEPEWKAAHARGAIAPGRKGPPRERPPEPTGLEKMGPRRFKTPPM